MGQTFSGFAVDASGNLLININAQGLSPIVSADVTGGTPGSAAPAKALQVGGTDGTDLRALLTDATGQLKVLVENTVPISGTIAVTQSTSPWITKSQAEMVGQAPGTAPTDTGIVGGIYNSAAPTPTNGQTLALQLDSAGNLKVNVEAGSSGNAAASATGAAVPADADYTGLNLGGNLVGQTAVNPSGSVYAAQVDITSVAGTTAVTAAAGVLKVGIVGHAGGVVDAVLGAAIPANAILMGGSDGTDIRALSTDTQGNQTTRPAVPTAALSSSVIINVNSTGNNFIIAGSAGKTIRIMAIDLQVSGITGGTPTTVTFKDGTSTALTGPYAFLNGASFTKDFSGEPWYICSTSGASSGFNINQSGTAQLSGTIWYTQS